MRAAAGAILAALALVAAPAGAETLYRVTELAVHDAHGKKVGTLNPSRGAPSEGAVAFSIGAHVVFASVGPKGLGGPADGGVFFATPDCSGQAYIILGRGGLYRTGVAAGPRLTVWLQSGPFTLDRERTLLSQLTAGGGCADTGAGITSLTSAPARKTDVHLRERFVPPFRLRATRGAEVLPPHASGGARARTSAAARAPDALYRTGPLGLVDAAGTLLGATTPYWYAQWWEVIGLRVALMTSGGTVFVVESSGDRLVAAGAARQLLHFEQPGCAGTPLIEAGGRALTARIVVHGPRWRVWWGRGPATVRTLVSHLDESGTCVDGRGTGIDALLIPAVAVGLDLADYFAAPFAVRAPRAAEITPLGP